MIYFIPSYYVAVFIIVNDVTAKIIFFSLVVSVMKTQALLF